MKVRLGYACISKTLDITTSKTYTYTKYKETKDNKKLEEIIEQNLHNLIETLKYNIKNNIHFYRLSSNIIPLATHKEVNINYLDKYKKYYKTISNLINKNNLRIDLHASPYCILNSTKKEVIENTMASLEYYYNLLNIMNIKNKLVILHIGSNEFGKKNSLTRFINNFKLLPKHIQDIIAIENDDKTFTIDDCLSIREKINIKIVLDYHHFLCNNTNNNIEDYLQEIFNTWKNITPKIHFSSPKNKKEYRAHNDYIEVESFIKFINICQKYNEDIDIMLEAKEKDEALFRLTRQLKYLTNYNFIDESTFIP